jgi:hypothetical protein
MWGISTARYSSFEIILQMPYIEAERFDLKFRVFIIDGSTVHTQPV